MLPAMTIANDKASFSAAANIFDVGSLATLKRQAKTGDPAANKAVAKQFEALFLQMVLKSMRDAMPREGFFDSEQSRMYESLLDQQLGQVLGGSNRGMGLAAMIEAQLLRQNQAPQPFDGPLPLRPAVPNFLPWQQDKALPLSHAVESAPLPLQNSPVTIRSSPVSSLTALQPMQPAVSPAPTFLSATATDAQRAFVDRLLPAALAAEQKTGIPAHFIVAQAALETGWGKSVPRHADGSSSFNLFGIKAGANWRGPSVAATTTEVIAGTAQRQIERFRAYVSYEDAVKDYVQLLTNNPRYAAVLGTQESSSFARGLQSAGFATDPMYAAKLERIIGSTVLQQALIS